MTDNPNKRSTDDDDEPYAKVSHNVPKSVKEDAQQRAEWGELSDRVRSTYRMVAYGVSGGKEHSLRQELETLRDRKDRLRSRIRELNAEIEDVERRETRVEEQLDELRGREERYEGHLSSIEEQIRDGMAVFEDHGAIRRASEEGGKSPGEVIDDLKERNRDIPDRAFKRQTTVAEKWQGVDSDRRLRSE